MNKKILLISGVDGRIGYDYRLSKPMENWEYVFLNKSELDITNKKQVSEAIEIADAFLNLGAFTDIEGAEKNVKKAFKLNAVAPKMIAAECNKKNIPLIHISTDMVFDGIIKDQYSEDDAANPINKYGASKLIGEQWIEENHDWFYIIRTSNIYSNNTDNFFTNILKFAQERTEVFLESDRYFSITSIKEFIRCIDNILKDLNKFKSGIYHFSNDGKTTMKDVGKEIFRQCSIDMKISDASLSKQKNKIEMPVNTSLNSNKYINTFNYTPMHWKNALYEMLSERNHLPVKVGDTVILDDKEMVIITTDWVKEIAYIAEINNMNKYIEISFDNLIYK